MIVSEVVELDKSKFIFRPFSGQVNCGLFGIAEDYEQRKLSLDALFVKKEVATFFLRATGDSMYPTVLSGDILIVDASLKPRNGKIVICELDGQRICKRLFTKPILKLASDNPKFKSIYPKDDDVTESFSIFGVVTGIARKF